MARKARKRRLKTISPKEALAMIYAKWLELEARKIKAAASAERSV